MYSLEINAGTGVLSSHPLFFALKTHEKPRSVKKSGDSGDKAFELFKTRMNKGFGCPH